MSGAGAPDDKPIDCHDLRVAVVASSWHDTVMNGLLEGARRCLSAYRVEAPDVVRVPGAFELPVVAHALAANYDAVIALGVVIRGGTPHFDYVCNAETDRHPGVERDPGEPVGGGVADVVEVRGAAPDDDPERDDGVVGLRERGRDHR